MYLEERRQKIVEVIKAQEVCSVEELSQMLNVSLVTIRKDLDFLEKENIVIRTFGGAMLVGDSTGDTIYDAKKTLNKGTKSSICKYASTYIQDGNVILIDAGSTATELSPFIKNKKNITVITFNLEAAMVLSYYKNVTCIFIGGEVSKNSKSCTGAGVVAQLHKMHVDISFIGCDGFTLEEGAYTTSIERSYIKEESIRIAKKSVLLATSEKYQQKKIVSFMPLNKFGLLVFDDENILLNKDLQDSGLTYKLIS